MVVKRNLKTKSTKAGSSGKGKPKAGDQKKKVDLSWNDEEITSEEDDDDVNKDESESEEEESAEQKRKRLAKEYLNSMTSTVQENADTSEDEDELIVATSDKLQQQRLLLQGKYFREYAVDEETNLTVNYYSGHKQSVTCVALTNDGKVYSGSKDNAIIKWDAETGKKRFIKSSWSFSKDKSSPSNEGEILSLAVSSDNRYLVSGGRDKAIRVFDIRLKEAEIKVLQGHRDAITGVCFRRDSYSLFSTSLDRTLKHWDLNEMGYLETMFGHQDEIFALDCWTRERPLSSSSDRSLRLWKVAEESHLVFRGPKGTVDAVQYLTDDSFLSGSQDGSLSLWKEALKKPVVTAKAAHGMDGVSPRWICSVASLKMSNLAVSGSYDGYLRFWDVNAENKTLVSTREFALPGFVNDLKMNENCVVAALGTEHKFGRWWNLKGNKNKVAIIHLPESVRNQS